MPSCEIDTPATIQVQARPNTVYSRQGRRHSIMDWVPTRGKQPIVGDTRFNGERNVFVPDIDVWVRYANGTEALEHMHKVNWAEVVAYRRYDH